MVELRDFPKPEPKPLNGSQFSQGSLFNMKPDAAHRWPAGYTPERKAAVASSLSDVKVKKYDEQGRNDLFLSSKTFFTPDPGDPHRGTWARKSPEIIKAQETHARGAITDTLARSTVPIEDLKGMPTIHVEELPTSSGDYWRPGLATTRSHMGEVVPDPKSEKRGRIRLDSEGRSSRAWSEKTIIHELGHHVDYKRDPEAFESAPRDETYEGRASPLLEGAAEGYAARHHVPRRDEPDPSYASAASYTGYHGNPDFDRRFTEVSGKTPQEAMAGPTPPPVHMGPQFHQPHLFGRPAGTSETETEKDYGQWGYSNYTGERESDLGTIKVGRGAPPQEQRMQPGFKPGDSEMIAKMQRGMSYEVPKDDQGRIGKLWNSRRPNDRLRGT